MRPPPGFQWCQGQVCFRCRQGCAQMTLAEMERGHDIDVDCNEWEEPLYRPFRYIVLYGGRSSGKTQAIAKKLVLESHAEYHVIYCVREHQKSLGLSAKPAIENWINRLGLAPLVSRHQRSDCQPSYGFGISL